MLPVWVPILLTIAGLYLAWKRTGLPIVVAALGGISGFALVAMGLFIARGPIFLGVAAGVAAVATGALSVKIYGLQRRSGQPKRDEEAQQIVRDSLMGRGGDYILFLSSPGSEAFSVDNPFGLHPRFSDQAPPAREIAVTGNVCFGDLIVQIAFLPVVQFAREKPEPGPGVVDPQTFEGPDVIGRIIANAAHIIVVPVYSRDLVAQLRSVAENGRLPDTTFIIPGTAASAGRAKAAGLAEMKAVLAQTIHLPDPGSRTCLVRFEAGSAQSKALSRSSLEAYWWVRKTA